MLDTQAGTPTITAATGGQSTGQTEIVTAPGAPLSIGNAANTVTFDEGGPPVAVDPSLAVTDSQSTTLASATVAISSGLSPGDTLTATTTGTNITASYSTGTLTLSGPDTLANYQTVLRTVSFNGSASTDGSRMIIWTANDGITTAPAVSTIDYAVAPDPPGEVSATAGGGQATVSFSAPDSDGGATITSYTVRSSPGGLTATASASPIEVGGLTNGTSYSYTVTATNLAGTGPASVASNPVTPAASSVGGGGGGGGGSSSIALTVNPQAQTIASGSTATWTITITNTGGAYLYAVGITDTLALSCDTPAAYSDALSFMAPNLAVTYACSLANVTKSLTNTNVASETTGPGPVITADVAAIVTLQAAATPPPAPVPAASPKLVSNGSRGFATLTVSNLKTVVFGTSKSKPRLSLTLKLSERTTLVLTLLDSRAHRLARWIEHEKAGLHKLALLLPRIARHKGHDTLRITETANNKPKTLPVNLRD